ncbi:CoA transferase subunit A [Streptomyces sp. NPDC056309]|uniref:CoA transferase subunit A n=1 Tax=unclassified Streptomyces TaxID=2593676 RepID=UPI0035DD2864
MWFDGAGDGDALALPTGEFAGPSASVAFAELDLVEEFGDALVPVGVGVVQAQGFVEGRIARVTGSYIGANKEFARQYLGGELEVEMIPQDTLAERLRAGGCGIPAFYTPAGVGTQVADGGLPWRYNGSGGIALASPPKEVREFDGVAYVLERGVRTDFALVRAAQGDRHGNLVFNKSSRNFNPLAAMAGQVTIAEVEELVEPGEIDPDAVHLPGIFVQRVVALTPEQAADKGIEKRTVSPPATREADH